MATLHPRCVRWQPTEFLNAEKEDQKLAEACKHLIKNCIVCRNYLYLSQQFAANDNPAKR
jgi:hypothetical protein